MDYDDVLQEAMREWVAYQSDEYVLDLRGDTSPAVDVIDNKWYKVTSPAVDVILPIQFNLLDRARYGEMQFSCGRVRMIPAWMKM